MFFMQKLEVMELYIFQSNLYKNKGLSQNKKIVPQKGRDELT